MSPRRWWFRSAVGVSLLGGLVLGSGSLDVTLDVPRTALVIALVVVVTGLLLDSVPLAMPGWADRDEVDVEHGADRRTAAHIRAIETHQHHEHPDPVLRDRIGALAEGILRARHGEPPETARAERLLGTDLSRLIKEPPRRIGTEELERVLTRIEAL